MALLNPEAGEVGANELGVPFFGLTYETQCADSEILYLSDKMTW